jgi:hypothetical protein
LKQNSPEHIDIYAGRLLWLLRCQRFRFSPFTVPHVNSLDTTPALPPIFDKALLQVKPFMCQIVFWMHERKYCVANYKEEFRVPNHNRQDMLEKVEL